MAGGRQLPAGRAMPPPSPEKLTLLLLGEFAPSSSFCFRMLFEARRSIPLAATAAAVCRAQREPLSGTSAHTGFQGRG